ncbi:hypothetical protein N3K66_002993 [Trichothecium roseum]|uniref:Uncharacterized protein n=1 Tax=Trichothecium roseum TaxID=47278 RepID=A0ACC0V5H4_9HYPO|nr:hypothetical protein N3K66_002993 [Trichothecium roseum]
MIPKRAALSFRSSTSSSLIPGRPRILPVPLSPPCRCSRPQQRSASTDNGSSNGSNNGKDARPRDDGGPPPPWPTKLHPTPYDIFAIPRSAPYTKKRFYQLAKLYHPDLSSSSTTTIHQHPSSSSSSSSSSIISHATRLERYRLVVAANDILSSPSKRVLYDTHGLGWHLDAARAPSLRDVDRAWRAQPNSPAMNATWEDWERWYEARDGRAPAPRPNYMSNGVFAVLVALTVLVGALAQSQRAGRAGQSYMEHTEAVNAAVGDQVRRSAVAAAGMRKDERVDRFLRDRENVAYHFNPAVYESQLAGESHAPQNKGPKVAG